MKLSTSLLSPAIFPIGAPTKSTESYVRPATIPPGNALLAQSTFFTTVAGAPIINPVNSFPFTDAKIPGQNENPTQVANRPGYLDQYTKGVLPHRVSA